MLVLYIVVYKKQKSVASENMHTYAHAHTLKNSMHTPWWKPQDQLCIHESHASFPQVSQTTR